MAAFQRAVGARLRELPGSIWALGFASLFMDASSELVHSLLPMFLAGTLGASIATIGLIEGVAEATAAITKVFSGAISDRLGRRKPLLLLGYGLAALTKPAFPLAGAIGSIGLVAGARFVDRVGKGIRGAPRDALVADITAPAQRGAAYGLRQALDAAGAFVGPLLALILMALLADRIEWVLWAAVIPAVVTMLILIVFVREPEAHTAKANRLAWRGATGLGATYWGIVVLGAVFTLARFSEAFLVLRAQDVGLAIGWVPAVMVVMNLVFTAGAYPAGAASDNGASTPLLYAGLAALIGADILLATATAPTRVFAGAALWGLHMALTQGLFARLVADASPPELRASAFGVFNLVSGVALLVASVVAGALWSSIGPGATFLTGAGFALVTAVGLYAVRRARSARRGRNA